MLIDLIYATSTYDEELCPQPERFAYYEFCFNGPPVHFCLTDKLNNIDLVICSASFLYFICEGNLPNTDCMKMRGAIEVN